jgi:hypothetical protein
LIQNPFTFEKEKAFGICPPELTDMQAEAFHSNTQVQFYKCLSGSKFPTINGPAAKKC